MNYFCNETTKEATSTDDEWSFLSYESFTSDDSFPTIEMTNQPSPPKPTEESFIWPTTDEAQKWYNGCLKKGDSVNQFALKAVYAGIMLYEDLSMKPCSFKVFMLKYLGAASIGCQWFADAWQMLHNDFKKYLYYY